MTSPQPKATLHLIPVGLGDAPINDWLPSAVQSVAGGLSVYIAENAKTARAFLKLMQLARPLQEITIHELGPRVENTTLEEWLRPLKSGQDIGLVSEAGCPAVADPGSRAVTIAHNWGMNVKPWVGPSSILLGLMASGLDGQRFAFHGYAPVDATERAKQLKLWENNSAKNKQTQLLIETPYRNNAMFAGLLGNLKGNTRLCVARSITTSEEWIRTLTVAQWKTQPPPALDKHPTLFLFLAQ
ncbi:SAM-dependent methyltransferase [Orrella sp. NBD-18]|uniref:SAM-dependent methyltransferase n=1 Tax=Sheuella amnicola TaxID=2707330 RepID=A0A6B2QYS5_9BURK|nr:SAM-dependent methyltransferase [Sheuella amnicola]NDY83123.1 SAM-dependent methyltransferase [Sheuella amnicola]HBI84485.1 SAM-dependent methyltransferase [Alcaligenaceae bacterium]